MNGRNALQEELMTTIKLTIEYDGSRYPGFSTKKKSASIESKLTLAIREATIEMRRRALDLPEDSLDKS